MRQLYRRYLAAASLAGLLPLFACERAPEHAVTFDDAMATRDADIYYDQFSLWWGYTSGETPISVCWESSGWPREKGIVRDAVLRTWGFAGYFNFTGWGSCTSAYSGIRIAISDEQPHVKGLGTNIQDVDDGMVLNFSFGNWGTSCQNSIDSCIASIAVHEFGHAIGFAHEHNRPDTPGTCHEDPQGSNGTATVGAWDLSSIMNYCNPIWNNNGELSATDVEGVRQVYRIGPTFVAAISAATTF